MADYADPSEIPNLKRRLKEAQTSGGSPTMIALLQASLNLAEDPYNKKLLDALDRAAVAASTPEAREEAQAHQEEWRAGIADQERAEWARVAQELTERLQRERDGLSPAEVAYLEAEIAAAEDPENEELREVASGAWKRTPGSRHWEEATVAQTLLQTGEVDDARDALSLGADWAAAQGEKGNRVILPSTAAWLRAAIAAGKAPDNPNLLLALQRAAALASRGAEFVGQGPLAFSATPPPSTPEDLRRQRGTGPQAAALPATRQRPRGGSGTPRVTP